ncbi:MAG: cell division protein SepF [Pseudonocardiales bacterium]|nr:cell division protein SepF [Pseudonocardiales bacterium]
MPSMHRLKAYFGMVPAEEMDDYLGYDEGADDLDDGETGRVAERGYGAERSRYGDPGARPERSRVRVPETPRGSSGTVVRGALAMDADVDDYRDPEPTASFREPARPTSLRPSMPLERGPICRITTLQPRSYDEARTVGERYREGSPVIMNLTDLDDAAAKRLVDFAAGLAFALRGSIEKVTSRVFLLSPPGVEVAPSDARRLAEHGLFGQD